MQSAMVAFLCFYEYLYRNELISKKIKYLRIMVKNLYSLGLLRNGKVYQTKELAIQGLTQTATNDGVAKLARYLCPVVGGDPIIRTLVGFYANANEMEDNGGGQSYYTILDIEGSSADIQQIKQDIEAINDIIGDGIGDKTLTDAIDEINDKIGSGFSENYTIADALNELAEELADALTITLDIASDPGDYAKVYELKQGGELIGTIDIPKDIVVKEGTLVYGYWSGDTFTEDEEGPDLAIKLVLNNDDVIYINAKDLVDTYTAGDGINIDDNEISIKLDRNGEPFLTVGENGLRLSGVQTAIDNAIEMAKLEGSDGISIASNQVKAVAAGYSAPAVKNPISIGKDGIKFTNMLDCGYFDDETQVANTAEDIAAIVNPSETDVFINGDGAFNALSNKTFNNIEAANIEAANQVSLAANEAIVLDGVDVTGDKGSSNAFILLSSPEIEVTNITVEDGAKPYNVFEQTGSGSKLDSFNASNIKVGDISLKHNVFNIYNLEDDAVINISDGKFNINVNNSNILRLANYTNATGVTVNFENIEWTYENTPNKESADWAWAGIIIYQPAYGDVAKDGDLSKIQTWKFTFKNCKYNGVKVTSNNFGEHSQVFYLYNVGNDGSVKNPVAEGLDITFE